LEKHFNPNQIVYYVNTGYLEPSSLSITYDGNWLNRLSEKTKSNLGSSFNYMLFWKIDFEESKMKLTGSTDSDGYYNGVVYDDQMKEGSVSNGKIYFYNANSSISSNKSYKQKRADPKAYTCNHCKIGRVHFGICDMCDAITDQAIIDKYGSKIYSLNKALQAIGF
jgi:hypothetical protein